MAKSSKTKLTEGKIQIIVSIITLTGVVAGTLFNYNAITKIEAAKIASIEKIEKQKLELEKQIEESKNELNKFLQIVTLVFSNSSTDKKNALELLNSINPDLYNRVKDSIIEEEESLIKKELNDIVTNGIIAYESDKIITRYRGEKDSYYKEYIIEKLIERIKFNTTDKERFTLINKFIFETLVEFDQLPNLKLSNSSKSIIENFIDKSISTDIVYNEVYKNPYRFKDNPNLFWINIVKEIGQIINN